MVIDAGKFSRNALQSAIRSTSLSIRNLSRRVGLKNHAPLARYLAGKKNISLPLLLKVAQELGFQGDALREVVAGEFPGLDAMLQRYALTDSVFADGRSRPIQVVTRAFSSRMPLVLEILKLIGPATAKDIARCCHSAAGLTEADAAKCLAALDASGDVTVAQNRYKRKLAVNGRYVVPTKRETSTIRAMKREAFAMHAAIIGRNDVVQSMRHLTFTLSARTLREQQAAVQDLAYRLEELASRRHESAEDDVVVSLLTHIAVVATCPSPDDRPASIAKPAPAQ